ncbi:demethylmenaquinone methyltransferase [Priestia flexa]|jgi:demethylmenaquinone methyltransferase / 2-methoxy-6-polyprenyl-1,4-benzoquinol methylase|uniref:demethylmenaquinone methyltransferase n=1 Tax=Priestia flexa TaxID=86664 RepID=UPI0009571833|nr:demethylmenaquinone methyltransferase [Priestia flexa]AQX53911.1 bifunctional demethylmenaquinone methyltransferase/2-methoxy-6-polyprenyl-1,4-benzoquinol methylase [Priestia flexa]MBY6084938.1 demethylmenaquinone methyltransferase [Priestia flexa]MCA1200466.1 demethylmenaquinone methyltransferase [Priestia flexa]MCP1190425.1 demethylmenaquinone methyltransferase [Priestia flexa]WEZ09760.1 demethylmenaquinone methyltransferase [Priestia flexa]
MQQSKEERVHGVFEKIYKNYDQMNSVISFQRHKAWRKDTMKRMDVQPGTTSLDVCCGTADWTLAMAEAVGPTGKAVGLDFSQNMLKIGHEKVNQSSFLNVELLHGNAMNLPFEDNSFDYVTIGFGLRNVPDYMAALKEMYRVVKPGGKVVCLETSQPTMIGYRQAYLLYFKYIMPAFGKLFAKSYDEYSWLQESARDFPGPKELAEMFKQAGFEDIEVKTYTGGVAAMHLGYKRV